MLRRGGDLPPEIRAGFEIWPVSEPFWLAFQVLNACRQSSGFGPLPISYTERAAYARDHGLGIDETVQILAALDAVFLEHRTGGDDDGDD